MRISELRDLLAKLSDEADADCNVFLKVDDYTCKLVNGAYVDEDNEIILKC
ncbi:hypothetical protein [Clostridium sporogenes]